MDTIDGNVAEVYDTLRKRSQYGHFAFPFSDLQVVLAELHSHITTSSNTSHRKNSLTKLWLDTEQRSEIIPSSFTFFNEPLSKLNGCTCPDGSQWHRNNLIARFPPSPVRKYAYNRYWQTDPDCYWCNVICPSKITYYTWLWRNVAKAHLTILAHPPYELSISFKQYRNQIDFALSRIHETVMPPYHNVIRSIMAGDNIDQETARYALTSLRSGHIVVKMEILECEAHHSEVNPFTKIEDAGLRAITYAIECAAFMPDKLSSDSCARMPIVPTWDRKRQRWVITGHFMVEDKDADRWAYWLEPLGVQFD